MKPVYLEMHAFGSYTDECIDFSEHDRGVFLITGNTGAGKTTIFDAMTYALYGDTSGGRRSGSMMRSQYADESVMTRVVLRFTYGGKAYQIERIPEQDKFKKNKKTGLYEKLKTRQKAAVTLTLPGDEVFQGSIAETNQKIVEIIGLDKEQFTQIAMIAQGDFLKLLLASSDERRRIFADIFNTGLYREIEMAIKQQCDAAADELGMNRRDIAQTLEGFGDETLQFSEADPEALMDRVGALCGQAEKDYGAADSAWKENSRNITLIQGFLESANRTNALFKEKETIEKDAAALNGRSEAMAALKARLELAGHAQAVFPAWQAMGMHQEAFSKTAALSKTLDGALSGAQETYERALEKENAAKQALSERQEDLQERIRLATLAVPQLEALERQRREAKKAGADAESARQALAALEQAHQKSLEALKTRRSAFDDMMDAVSADRVRFIRSMLKDGDPCPVCGGIYHPSGCEEGSSGGVKEDALSAAREALLKAEKKAEADGLKVQGQRLELAARQAAAKSLADSLTKVTADTPFASKAAANAALKAAREEMARLEAEVKEASGKLMKASDALAGAKARLEQNRETMARHQADLEAAAADFARECAAHGFKDEDDYRAARMPADEVKKAEEAIGQYQADRTRLTHELARLIRETEGRTPVDVSDFQAQLEKAQAAAESLFKRQQALYVRLENCRKAAGRVKALYEIRQGLLERHKTLQSLNDTAGGSLHGKRLRFETYVQRRYFMQIIDYANKRLIRMSGARFILQCRALGKVSGNAYIGLDLDVYDMISGQTRDIKSLSGGESFLASLALALGMADLIRLRHGNVRLETMFIDEGFGSLSDDVRQGAVAVLNELSGGQNLIGIISHVSELKTQIDTQLVVTKDVYGSHAVWM